MKKLSLKEAYDNLIEAEQRYRTKAIEVLRHIQSNPVLLLTNAADVHAILETVGRNLGKMEGPK